MADEILIFDAAASNPDGTDPGSPLSIGPGTSYPLISASFPAPPLSVLYSSSIDTEGEIPVNRRYGNRTINLAIDMDESGANNTLLDALVQKVGKLQREGGTLKRTRKDGSTIRIYDIVAVDGVEPRYDDTYILGHSTGMPLQFPAKPLPRGAEVDLGDNVETTLPALVFTEAGNVTGDADALVRLVIDDDQAIDRQWLVYGIETDRFYDITQTSAALFYQAEGRTALGSSAIAAGPTGASGAGSNVMRNTALSTSYQAIMSTQATGGGAHLTHVGTFAVYARVQVPTSNTGAVSLALEWGEGDFRRFTQNATYALQTTWEGTWRIAPLGLVTIPKVLTGSQRWEGRILAKSATAGDDIDIDWLMLVPADVASGEVKALNRQPTSSGFSARDEFDQAAGALATKTLPVGGTWSGAGSATDFTVETAVGAAGSRAAAIHRDVGSEAIGSGRFALAGASTFTNITLSVDYMSSFGDAVGLHGTFARYTDTNNWVAAGYQGTTNIRVYKRVAGTVTLLSSVTGGNVESYQTPTPGGFVFTVYANGLWKVANRAGTLISTGYDADLATGGTLATGRIGIYDGRGNSGTAVRSLDNFWAAVPPSDAAIYASQSIQIRHDGVIREDSTGTFWQPPSSYIGDYPRVPPAGAEGRDIRTIIFASRFAPGEGPDAGIDDISARMFITPRFLT